MGHLPSPFRVLGCGLLLAMAALAFACGGSLPFAIAAESQPNQPAAEAAPARSMDAAGDECRHLADLIQQQKALFAREMGQVKRELAALRDDLTKPGLKEVFAGIGYILGLFGVGLYVHCRRGRTRS